MVPANAIGNSWLAVRPAGIPAGEALSRSETEPDVRCSDHFSACDDRDFADGAHVRFLRCNLVGLRYRAVSLGETAYGDVMAARMSRPGRCHSVSSSRGVRGATDAISGIGQPVMEAIAAWRNCGARGGGHVRADGYCQPFELPRRGGPPCSRVRR